MIAACLHPEPPDPYDPGVPDRPASRPAIADRQWRADTLRAGVAHHRAGRFADAARLYEAVLARDPADADALNLLGAASDAAGDPGRAVALIGQALAVRETAAARSNLGMALAHLGRHEEAVAHCRRAIALRPDDAAARINLAVSLQALGRFREAERACRAALALSPGDPRALDNLGRALLALDRAEEAIAAHEQALASDPGLRRAGLGHALRAAGRLPEAEAAFRHDVAAHPGDPDPLVDLAAVLLDLRTPPAFGEAVALCGQALALRPDNPEALVNLGSALHGLDRFAQAEAASRRGVHLRPESALLLNNLALSLEAQGRPEEALAVLDAAAASDPDDPPTHHHRGLMLLRAGRMREGWAEYEWRLRLPALRELVPSALRSRIWQGAPLEGRSLLLLSEQGLGDTIQFARYAAPLTASGAPVTLRVQAPLLRLMRSLSGAPALVTDAEALPSADLCCPLLSLPHILGTEAGARPPYLAAEPEAVARWAARLGAQGAAYRVGIVWAGNPQHLDDRRRSVPFAALAPLWRIEGVRWFSLQLGRRREEALESFAACGIVDLAPELTDFAETAAALTGLDLLVSVDTAAAHCAGALGRPAWLLLAGMPDWRWGRAGERSIWYSSVRLFRRPDPASAAAGWGPVIAQVAAALRERAAGPG